MADRLQQIQQQIEALQHEYDELLAASKAAAIEDIRAKMRQYGIQLSDLEVGSKAPARRRRPSGDPAAPRFRKGDLTWGGRGHRPQWVKNHLADGGTLDALRV